jgi:lipopolysaccharide transport system permease protein
MKLLVGFNSGQRLIYLRDLLRELVARDMKLRYRRSVLGVAWSLLNPLAQVLVLNFIFSKVLPLNIPDYVVFLFIGLLIWGWFQSSLLSGTGAIVDNRMLIKRPGFPSGVLPIVDVSTNFIHFILALPILFIFMIISHINITSALLALPILFVIQFIFTLSLVYWTATVYVNFRDTQYLLGIILLLGFYLSPVFYSPDALPENLQSIYYLNPMAILIESYRMVLMEGVFQMNVRLALLGLVSIILLWLGYIFFKRSSMRFVEEL